MQCVPAILAAQNQRLGRPLGDEDLADAVQDTLIVIWKKLPEFEGRAALETWVYRFCYLELMNGVRRVRRRPERSLEEEEQVAAHLAQVDRGEVRFAPVGSVDTEALFRVLDRLGPPGADVIRMKYFGQMTFEEIARLQDVSPNTAKTRFYRGLVKLRAMLEGDGLEGEGETP